MKLKTATNMLCGHRLVDVHFAGFAHANRQTSNLLVKSPQLFNKEFLEINNNDLFLN